MLSAATLPASPFGVSWMFLYGHFGVPPAEYAPQLREIAVFITLVN